MMAKTYTIKSTERMKVLNLIEEHAHHSEGKFPETVHYYDENNAEIARTNVMNGHRIPTVFDPPIPAKGIK